jgi:hypothetical protein
MLPMVFPDKRAAITAAFIARFGIGFAIGAARPLLDFVVHERTVIVQYNHRCQE